MVNERTSAACFRSTIRSDRIHFRRMTSTRDSIVRYCIRALRTDAHPSGTAVSRSSGSSSGCSTPSVPAAATMPTSPVRTSTACWTTRGADVMPRVCARWRSSRKSESSSAVRCTAVVVSYSRSSASRCTCGLSRDWDQPAAACSAARSATAPATSASDGSASRTRPGVGPALNSAVSTPVVASSQNAVKTPATRLRDTVATVSTRLARQASPAACAITAGSRRATVPRPVSASSLSFSCHRGAVSSGRPDEAEPSPRRPPPFRRRVHLEERGRPPICHPPCVHLPRGSVRRKGDGVRFISHIAR